MGRSISGDVQAHDGLVGFRRIFRKLNPRAIDLLVALALTVVAMATVVARLGTDSQFRQDDLLGTVLVLAQTVPLAVLRAAPLRVLALISGAVAVHSALGYEMVQAGTFGSLVALYSASLLSDSHRGVFAAAVAAVALAVFFATNRGHWSLAQMAATIATWAVAWFAGTFVRQRSAQAQHADARAVALERERDARAREAVADERARMARELHDIVGHALNVVVIQAAGARRVLDVRPEVARDALDSIESTGREALSEMERMLGVLRDPDTDAGGSGPQPGLGQLDALAAHVSEAGLPVKIIIEGDPQAFPRALSCPRTGSCRNRSRTASSTRAPLTLR